MLLKNPGFKSYSFKSGSFINSASQCSHCHSKPSNPKIPTTPKSSISVFPTNCNSFSYWIPSVIKSNDPKSACMSSQTSHLLRLPLKFSKHLVKSFASACQSTFSQNQKVFYSASLFQVFELPFQGNATATLPFTTIPSRSSGICMFLLNFLFSFILLTFLSCFILNLMIHILLTVLVVIKFYTNTAGFLFRLVDGNRSLITLIMELINTFQYGALINKMTFSNINLLNKAILIMVPMFLEMNIRKAFYCNIVSSENFLELNYLKLIMSANKEVFNFLTILFFGEIILNSQGICVCFFTNAASFILIITIFVC